MKKLKLILLLSLFGVVAFAQAPHYCDSVQADFTSTAPECTGNSVTFVNSGYSHFNCTYEWDFGASSSPASHIGEFPPGVTYTLGGVKEVTITVTDVVTGCVSYKTHGIMIYENPTVSFNSTSLTPCEYETVDFTNTGSTGAGWTYTWDFGEGAIPSVSSAENPSGVYWTTSGSKTVTLNITNGNCTESTNLVINVNEAPVVDFTTNTPSCTGYDVDFTNLGSSAGHTFSWDFGTDATPLTSTSENPSGVVYSSSGSKHVSLTITNSITSCSTVYTDDILIRETPTVSISSSGDDCLGSSYDFTNTGSTGAGWSYSWDFGEGANPQISAAENPTGVEYTTSGVKNISLTISSVYCSNSTVDNVEVYATPVSDFSSTAPVCTGLNVDFVNTGSTGGHTYAWDFGADATPSTSTDENPVDIAYSAPGTKTVTLITTDILTGCTDQISQNITINTTPTVSFTYSGDDCVDAEIDFTNTGSTGGDWTYEWDFGEGATPGSSTAENPIGISYYTSGTKDVLLTISNGSCSNSSSQTITIYDTPESDFANTSPQCINLGVDFTNTGTSTDVTFAWDFGADATPATSTDENPMGVIYTTAGNKVVELVTTNTITGCSDMSTTTINIQETPVASFTHTDSLCLSATYSFTNTGSTGTNLYYTWDFGEDAIPPTANAENPTGVYYTTSGWKYVSFTIGNSNCSNTIIDSVYVYDTPDADFASTAPECSGLPVNFTNTGDDVNVTYEWDFGANASPATSTDEDPQNVVYDMHGTKEVQLVITHGITSCTDTVTHTITINETPTASFSSTAPVCGDEGVDFSNTGSSGSNWTYSWDFGENSQPSSSSAENPTTVTYTQGGSKSITLNITNGVCSNSHTESIEVFEFPEINAGNDTTICADASLLLGSPEEVGFTYLWFPSSTLDFDTVAQPLASPEAQISNYILVVTDAAGCMSQDTIIVTMLPSAIANAGPDYDICSGDSIQIGTGLLEGQMYFWSPVEGVGDTLAPNPYVTPAQTTVYTLNTYYPGCDTLTDQVFVNVHQMPDVHATSFVDQDTIEIAEGEQIELIVTGAIQYEWSPAESLSNSWVFNPVAYPDSTTVYVVIGTDLYGCVGTDSITIMVNVPGVYIPNAFTPNNDGRNDKFYIRGKGTQSFQLDIFDRNGNLIYHSTNPDDGWDGTIQGTGKKVASGAYVYHTKGVFTDGEKFNESGMVNLIR